MLIESRLKLMPMPWTRPLYIHAQRSCGREAVSSSSARRRRLQYAATIAHSSPTAKPWIIRSMLPKLGFRGLRSFTRNTVLCANHDSKGRDCGLSLVCPVGWDGLGSHITTIGTSSIAGTVGDMLRKDLKCETKEIYDILLDM